MTKIELYNVTHFLSKGISNLTSSELIELARLLDKAKGEVEKAKKKIV